MPEMFQDASGCVEVDLQNLVFSIMKDLLISCN